MPQLELSLRVSTFCSIPAIVSLGVAVDADNGGRDSGMTLEREKLGSKSGTRSARQSMSGSRSCKPQNPIQGREGGTPPPRLLENKARGFDVIQCCRLVPFRDHHVFKPFQDRLRYAQSHCLTPKGWKRHSTSPSPLSIFPLILQSATSGPLPISMCTALVLQVQRFPAFQLGRSHLRVPVSPGVERRRHQRALVLGRTFLAATPFCWPQVHRFTLSWFWFCETRCRYAKKALKPGMV